MEQEEWSPETAGDQSPFGFRLEIADSGDSQIGQNVWKRFVIDQRKMPRADMHIFGCAHDVLPPVSHPNREGNAFAPRSLHSFTRDNHHAKLRGE
jgi:hypothetical protein